jgi:beta-ribofuranosylaminobenzene 5'-phosphate synthase
MKSLDEMKKELELKPIHKMFLTNTGSMTQALEALFGKIVIKEEIQRVIKAEAPLNQRVVRLFGEKTLVHATSFSPLSRLEKKFREDIMKTNIPIGKIMEMHSMESRREILGFDWFRAGTDFGNVFEVSRDRKYSHII